jgi:membrane dipeptidase
VTFVPAFVHPTEPNLERVVDHIDHIVHLAGPHFAGLGSDFDGGGTVLKDATVVPQITASLVRRGYHREDIERILGGNHLRMIKENIG